MTEELKPEPASEDFLKCVYCGGIEFDTICELEGYSKDTEEIVTGYQCICTGCALTGPVAQTAEEATDLLSKILIKYRVLHQHYKKTQAKLDEMLARVEKIRAGMEEK